MNENEFNKIGMEAAKAGTDLRRIFFRSLRTLRLINDQQILAMKNFKYQGEYFNYSLN